MFFCAVSGAVIMPWNVGKGREVRGTVRYGAVRLMFRAVVVCSVFFFFFCLVGEICENLRLLGRVLRHPLCCRRQRRTRKNVYCV